MYLYKIYDHNKALDGYYSFSETCKIMNVSRADISTYIQNGLTYKKRWRIERFTQKEVEELENAAGQQRMMEQAARQQRQNEINKNGASLWLGYLQFCAEFLKGDHHDRRNNETCVRKAAGAI